MFSWNRQRSRSRGPEVVQFSDEDKAKFQLAKNSHISTRCPIPIEDFLNIVQKFANTCGVFCFEKAHSFIVDYKSINLGPPISPSNPYIIIFNILEQLANCDRKYYILSYLEENEVTKTKPLRLSYAALLKLTNILHKGFLEIEFWVIVRLLKELQNYIKARICAINLYDFMISVANDCDIEWKEITSRGQSIIDYLLNDCRKQKKERQSWDTDSDVEHLNSTLDFLPVQEIIHEAEIAKQERRKERQNEKERAELLKMLEMQKQVFQNQLRHRKLRSVRKFAPQKEEQQPSCSTKPPKFQTGWSSESSNGSGSSSRLSSAVGSDNSDTEDNNRVKKSSLKTKHDELKNIKTSVTFSSNSSIATLCSSTPSSCDENDSQSSGSTHSSNNSTSNLITIIRDQQKDHVKQRRKIKKERLSDEKHPTVHLKNSYVHRVIDSFDKNEDLSKLSIKELKEKFEINLELMHCEERKLDIPLENLETKKGTKSRKKSTIQQEIRGEAEIEREELIWFKEAVENKIRLFCRESKSARPPWWKRLKNDMRCSETLKNQPDNSAEQCAARFLRQEKYLGMEGSCKNLAEGISVQEVERLERRKVAMQMMLKEKVLKKREELRKSSFGSHRRNTSKSAKTNTKEKNKEEGACYIDSSDLEEEEKDKKSFMLQKMRKLFAHEIYTLMLIFETQYNLAAGNMVRCVAYMNQLSHQFDFLSSELDAIEHEPEKLLSFKKSAPKPRNNLIHWFMHVYQLLQAKLCLYATDVFGPSCLTLRDYKDIQKYDNGYNFIERCVEFTQTSQAFFLCICVGGRNRISERDGNFESCMVLPEYGRKLRDVEKHYQLLLEQETENHARETTRITRKRLSKPTSILLRKHKLDHIYEMELAEATREIRNSPTLTSHEKNFLCYSIRLEYSKENTTPKPIETVEEYLVPIIFRLPSPINSEHNGIAMIRPEHSDHAFQLTSVFVQQHLHPKCLKYNDEMSYDRKSYRLVRYDEVTDKTYFGEAIERDLYMVIIYAGKVGKWERHVIEFLNEILSEIRCSNSLKLLSHAATSPELGVRGRVTTSQE